MKNKQKIIGSAALAAAIAGGGLLGALVGTPAVSGAQSATSSTAAATAPAAPAAPAATAQTPPAPANGQAPPNGPQHDPTQGGHVGTNGTVETLLTGATADSAKAAALAAVPDGTVQRVENDAEGATYEAHMTKADGSQVTVKLDANFAVSSIETGH